MIDAVVGPYLGVHRCRYHLDRWSICHPTQDHQKLQSRRLYPWSRIGRSCCICVYVHSHVSSQLFRRILDSRFGRATLGVGLEEVFPLGGCRFAALLGCYISRQTRLSPLLPLPIWSFQGFYAGLVDCVCVHGGDFPDQLHLCLLGLRSPSLFVHSG